MRKARSLSRFVPWLRGTIPPLVAALLLLPVPVFAAANWDGTAWVAFLGTPTSDYLIPKGDFTVVDGTGGNTNSTLTFNIATILDKLTGNGSVQPGTTTFVFAREFTTTGTTNNLSSSLSYNYTLVTANSTAFITVTYNSSPTPELQLGPLGPLSGPNNNQFGTTTGSIVSLPPSTLNSVNITVTFGTDVAAGVVAATPFTLTLNNIQK